MTNTKKNKNDEELKQLLEELKYKMLRLKEYIQKIIHCLN